MSVATFFHFSSINSKQNNNKIHFKKYINKILKIK